MLEKPHTFTFMHLADTFIQSDLQCIQAIYLYCQYVNLHLCELQVKENKKKEYKC